MSAAASWARHRPSVLRRASRRQATLLWNIYRFGPIGTATLTGSTCVSCSSVGKPTPRHVRKVLVTYEHVQGAWFRAYRP